MTVKLNYFTPIGRKTRQERLKNIILNIQIRKKIGKFRLSLGGNLKTFEEPLGVLTMYQVIPRCFLQAVKNLAKICVSGIILSSGS